MDPREEASLSSPKDCLRLLAESLAQIDSFKTMYTPGNSKITVYSELVELKNTLETLKSAALKFLALSHRKAPHTVLQAIINTLSEVLSILRSVDLTATADTWNATLLRLYQLDFLLAFQCHQLHELGSGHYQYPKDLLCTSQSREFWEQHFGAQVRTRSVLTHKSPPYAPTTRANPRIPHTIDRSQWFVLWATFWEHIVQRSWAEQGDEKAVKHFLDFCNDGWVSPYELCLFTKWFGPMESAFKNLMVTLKSGYAPGQALCEGQVWAPSVHFSPLSLKRRSRFSLLSACGREPPAISSFSVSL